MKYLVAYYSRTGRNKAIGEVVAKALNADLDEIIDKKKRSGRLGWLRAGRDATSEKLTEISFENNPQDYDVIILGSPIWAGKVTPALRTYLSKHNLKGKKVAFYICSGGEGYTEVFPQLQSMTSEAEHLGTLGITEKQFKEGNYETQLQNFILQLK